MLNTCDCLAIKYALLSKFYLSSKFFFEQKYLFLKTSDLTNPNRATLTTPKHLKSQKGIFVSFIRMNPSHSNKKSNFNRQNHMNNKLQL